MSVSVLSALPGAALALSAVHLANWAFLRDCASRRTAAAYELERRTAEQLAAAKARAHVVEGYLAVMADMDRAVAIIRGAADGAAAAAALGKAMGLSEVQAAAVLAMPLRRLTSLESGKLREEATTLAASVTDLSDVLARRKRVVQILVQETGALKARFAVPRRTTIVSASAHAAATAAAAAAADTAGQAPVLVTVSERGFVKRMDPQQFATQKMRTRGKAGGALRQDDGLMAALGARRCRSCCRTSARRRRSPPSWRCPQARRRRASPSCSSPRRG